MQKLLNYMPSGVKPFIEKWTQGYRISIKISRERSSKLGDYYKDRQGLHHISINHNLPPELFFLVLTHELAHLIAFEKYGKKIPPHGTHWKITYQNMLQESISIYHNDLQDIIIEFAKNPKANFLSFLPLAKYFSPQRNNDGEILVEELPIDSLFLYRGNIYQLNGKIKKNYLCTQHGTQRKYAFSPLTSVIKVKN